jgi:hypothetical protein
VALDCASFQNTAVLRVRGVDRVRMCLCAAQAALAQHPRLVAGPWADLGTGSGAIACGLASVLGDGAEVRETLQACAPPRARLHAADCCEPRAYDVYSRKHARVWRSRQAGAWCCECHSNLPVATAASPAIAVRRTPCLCSAHATLRPTRHVCSAGVGCRLQPCRRTLRCGQQPPPRI